MRYLRVNLLFIVAGLTSCRPGPTVVVVNTGPSTPSSVSLPDTITRVDTVYVEVNRNPPTSDL
jgi:3-dehydroquinate dehydratase